MSKLREEVNFKNVVIALLDRFISRKEGLDLNVLGLFYDAIVSLVEVKIHLSFDGRKKKEWL